MEMTKSIVTVVSLLRQPRKYPGKYWGSWLAIMSTVSPNACSLNILVYVVLSGLCQILHFGFAITLFVTCPESSTEVWRTGEVEMPSAKKGPTQMLLPGVSVP